VKLSVRVLLGFFLIVGLAAFFVLRIFMAEVSCCASSWQR